ncbi:MAG: hypothetical protein ACXU8N_21935 [Telluria sp.]
MGSGSSSQGSGSQGGMGSSGAMSSTGSTGGSMAGNGSDSVTRATGEVHNKIDQAAQAARPMVDRLANSAHAGVDKMTGMLSGATQSLSQRSGQLNETYQDVMASSREYVRNNPGAAIAMAVGAGFILAKLFSGSNRD